MIRVVTTLLVGLVLLPSCIFRDDDPEEAVAAAQEAEVTAFDFYFEPATLIFEPEARVTIDFTNAGENTHSLTISDLDLEVEAAAGQSNSLTFVLPDGPGPYEFFCEYHPDEMRGTLTVEADEVEVDDDEDVDVDVDTDTDTDTETDGATPEPTTS